MEKELEIEYKSLVSAEKYVELRRLVGKFAEEKESYEQVNYFFDSEDGLLDQKGITLRIRSKKNTWQLTAKIKQKTDNTSYTSNQEINETISEEKAKHLLENGIDDVEPVVSEMVTLAGITEPIVFQPLGSLTTLRTDYGFYDDTISLDHNEYNGIVDFELEWESANHTFVQFIQEHFLHIPFDNGSGKRKRFLKSLTQ